MTSNLVYEFTGKIKNGLTKVTGEGKTYKLAEQDARKKGLVKIELSKRISPPPQQQAA